jgi:hypothetical protein
MHTKIVHLAEFFQIKNTKASLIGKIAFVLLKKYSSLRQKIISLALFFGLEFRNF